MPGYRSSHSETVSSFSSFFRNDFDTWTNAVQVFCNGNSKMRRPPIELTATVFFSYFLLFPLKRKNENDDDFILVPYPFLINSNLKKKEKWNSCHHLFTPSFTQLLSDGSRISFFFFLRIIFPFKKIRRRKSHRAQEPEVISLMIFSACTKKWEIKIF